MDSTKRADLCIVPADRVLPHEIADPTRLHRIQTRLQDDTILRDPVMVGSLPDLDAYILLDGTNRKRALAALGLPWLLVQIVDYTDQHCVQLRTWCHATPLPLEDLLRGMEAIPGIRTVPLPSLEAAGALASSDTLAVVLGSDEQHLLTRVLHHDAPRATQLRRLVDLYENTMERQDCDPEDVERQARSMTTTAQHPATLIAFPPFSRSQVVTMAMRGTLIPAGITRHVILCGRVLRVNLPLEILSDEQDVDRAQAALQDHLNTLQPRLYREPTILFDS